MNFHARISRPALALALALATAGLAPAGFAQTSPPSPTDQDHNAHHPAEGAPAATPTPGPTSAPSAGAPKGMMGQRGQAGMMGGDTKQMMSMMRNMMTMMSADTGMMLSNVEGRIASLKTELKIIDAQEPQWNRFADGLRGAGKSMNGMYGQMMQTGATATLQARLDRQETMLSTHLSSLKALKEALEPLYASFSDEQKELADGLMIGPMGMM